MNQFKFLLLFFIIVNYFVENILNYLNFKYLQQNCGIIPEELSDIISEKKLKQLDSYNKDKSYFSIFNNTFSTFILIIFLFTPLLNHYLKIFHNSGLPYFLEGSLFFIILSLISSLVEMPFDYFYNFKLEQKYNFNKHTLKTWFIDNLKNWFVSSIIIFIIFSIVLSLTGQNIKFNWTWVITGILLFFILLTVFMYLVPLILLPFFYKLKPFEKNELSDKINNLVNKTGFKIRGIFIADESKRSTHANAAFTGFGKSKTIIIFDTMLEKFSENEILSTLAHEIGHGKHHHQIKLLFISLIQIAVLIPLTLYILSSDFLFQNMNLPKNFYAGILIVFIFYSNIISLILKPFFNYLSRKFEYQADSYSKKIMGSGEHLISTLKKFVKNDLANINPHPLYEKYSYSHPSIIKRINNLKK